VCIEVMAMNHIIRVLNIASCFGFHLGGFSSICTFVHHQTQMIKYGIFVTVLDCLNSEF